METGIILYEGPSELTGEPIVTILVHRSNNAKTGDMAQVMTFTDNGYSPYQNVRDGTDDAVCGDCPLRGGACYVQTWRAEGHVWRKYMAGGYPHWDGKPYPRPIRWGAYGDPTATPIGVVRAVMPDPNHPHTGYTAQWRDERFQDFRRVLMASCHSPADVREAEARGWKAFEAVLPGTKGVGKPCPAMRGAKCETCLRCSGTSKAKNHYYVELHGPTWKRHPLALTRS